MSMDNVLIFLGDTTVLVTLAGLAKHVLLTSMNVKVLHVRMGEPVRTTMDRLLVHVILAIPGDCVKVI